MICGFIDVPIHAKCITLVSCDFVDDGDDDDDFEDIPWSKWLRYIQCKLLRYSLVSCSNIC